MEFTSNPNLNRSKRMRQHLAFNVFRALSFLVVAILVVILGFIIINGFSALSWDFLTEMPKEGMTKGGIFSGYNRYAFAGVGKHVVCRTDRNSFRYLY